MGRCEVFISATILKQDILYILLMVGKSIPVVDLAIMPLSAASFTPVSLSRRTRLQCNSRYVLYQKTIEVWLCIWRHTKSSKDVEALISFHCDCINVITQDRPSELGTWSCWFFPLSSCWWRQQGFTVMIYWEITHKQELQEYKDCLTFFTWLF